MSAEGEKNQVSQVLSGMTVNALRLQIEHAERQADLAMYIDNFERAQREHKYWLGIARQIRAEVDRRAEARQGAASPGEVGQGRAGMSLKQEKTT